MIKYFLALFILIVFCPGLYLHGYVICNLFLDWYKKWRDNNGKF